MQRRRLEARADWRERARVIGFDFAEIGHETYWDETACWTFTAAEIDVLEDATNTLEALCLEAAEHAVRFARHEVLGISKATWPMVVRSWERREPSLYGRMDLRWDGRGAPVLLEYNADTPTALYEASVVQWEWLACTQPGLDQFNSIHEALIAAWRGMGLSGHVHFTAVAGSVEDRGTVDYLQDTARQAGLDTGFVAIEDIGWDGRRFVDLEGAAIGAVFKLYPWEWLLRERFGAHVADAPTRWIEPAWRLLLSGKGILALLWELFAGHPNLVAASRAEGRTGGPEVRKPLWGREGANITAPGVQTGGPYGAEGWVHQAFAPLPCVDGRYPVIGSWVVGGRAVGIGLREDDTAITRDTSRFVPHCFTPFPAPPEVP